MSNPSSITLYDTTLRDGSQGEGINFSCADKLRIARRLDAFGMHYIEGGWPGSNEKDIEFFREAKKIKFQHARLAAFGSTRRADAKVEEDKQVALLLEAGTPVVTLVCKASLLHVKEILRTTPEENLAMIRDTIRYLVAQGREVIFDGEHTFDGYKLDPEYTTQCYQIADEAGASYLVLCDTNGGSLPTEIADITKKLSAKIESAKLGIHTHDDCGLAVANALAGIEAGALQVQGTVNGYGERTGNCNLITTIANLQLKMNRRVLADNKLAELRDLSLFVDEVANQRPSGRAPFVGAAAFAHKGGIHVNAIKNSPAATSTSSPRKSATPSASSSANSPAAPTSPSRPAPSVSISMRKARRPPPSSRKSNASKTRATNSRPPTPPSNSSSARRSRNTNPSSSSPTTTSPSARDNLLGKDTSEASIKITRQRREP